MACQSAATENETLSISSEARNVHLILGNVSMVPLEYQVFIANFSSLQQIDVKFNVRPLIHLGLCLPRSCDASLFYKPIEEYLESQEGIQNVTVQYHKLGLEKKFVILETTEFYLLVVIILITVTLSVIYDKFMRIKIVDTNNQSKDSERGAEKNLEDSAVKKVIKCFSIRDNRTSLFNTSTYSKEIRDINGIR